MKVLLELDGEEYDAFVSRAKDNLTITIDGQAYDAKVGADGTITLAGRNIKVDIREKDVVVDGAELPFRIMDVKTGAAGGEGSGARGARVKPPMPGKIVSIAVNEGDEVQAGQVLLILEAMKMQNEITAPAGGTVKKIHVKTGQNVEGKDLLLELE